MNKIIGIGIVVIGLIVLLTTGTMQLGGVVQNTPTYSDIATSGIMSFTSSTQVLATTSRRTYAVICNTTATNSAYLSFRADRVPANGLLDFELGTGECYEIDNDNLYVGAVRATSSTGTINLTVTEFKD